MKWIDFRRYDCINQPFYTSKLRKTNISLDKRGKVVLKSSNTMSTSKLTKKQWAYLVLEKMEERFTDAKTELANWSTPFQFIICIILSAQATDKGVNKVTAKLFELYPDSKTLAQAKQEDVEQIIGSINYFRAKSKYIIKSAQIIEGEFNGKMPDTLEDLMKLAGVGYKTANVFLNDLYHRNEGIAVDTHVMRVAQRLGLTAEKEPIKIAKDLEKLYDRPDWYRINSAFVLWGRYVCTARGDECELCKLIMRHE
jgi:endonuclease III